mmetsp:Transcript_14514/g.26102  ORF Transcript_14514/g.26102 Transcript_14514/m.26102 type:complete len:275 (+) Transcript_14514:703-1527(+)
MMPCVVKMMACFESAAFLDNGFFQPVFRNGGETYEPLVSLLSLVMTMPRNVPLTLLFCSRCIPRAGSGTNNGRDPPPPLTYLGRRMVSIFSVFSASTNVAVFPTPFKVWLAALTTPEVGLATTPSSPLAAPLKKPPTPSFCAPLMGSTTMPVTPSKMPIPTLLAPDSKPSPRCLGFSLVAILFLAMKSSSIDKVASPLLRLPVTCPTAPNADEMADSTSILDPLATPRPNPSKPGSSTMPLAGSVKKDATPSAMFSIAATGFPSTSSPNTILYH